MSRSSHPVARWTILVALLAALCSQAFATTYRPASPEALALRADLVFFGEVADVTRTEADGLPWTVVTFQRTKVVRDRAAEAAGSPGTSEDAAVTLRFLGGSMLGEADLTVSGLPAFVPGQRWLVLAYQDAALASPIVGVAQGAWLLSGGGAVDSDGRTLGVSATGALVREGAATTEAELAQALATLLERGTESPPEPQGDTTPEAPATVGGAPQPPGQTAPGSPPATEIEAPDTVSVTERAPEPEARPPGAAAPPSAPTRPPTPAVTYRVEDAGGPLLLSELAADAAGVWEAAAPGTAVFSQDPAAITVVRYGPDGLLGEALSLTLQRSGRIEVLVSPTAGASVKAALVHELGILLGLPEGGAGIMARALAADVATPTPAEVAELLDRRAYPPMDLDRSGAVDFYDLAAFGRAYGQTGVNLAADFNGDGKVDGADLELLREAYEFGAPSRTAPPRN